MTDHANDKSRTTPFPTQCPFIALSSMLCVVENVTKQIFEAHHTNGFVIAIDNIEAMKARLGKLVEHCQE